MLKNFQPYYLKAYSFELEYKLSNIKNGVLNLRHILPGDDAKALSKDEASPDFVSARSIPVLAYHGIVSEPDGANTTLIEFIEQMQALKQEGYQTISMNDLYDFMLGRKEFPDKSFVLTFDDGRKDSYYPVDPVLKALGYRAAIFVIVKQALETKSSYYLHREELVKMNKSGRWDIEAHAYEGHGEEVIDAAGSNGHFFSSKIWLADQNRSETVDEYRARIEGDLRLARDGLEAALGKGPIAFAYPYGDFGQQNEEFPEAMDILHERTRNFYQMGFYQMRGEGFSWNHLNPDSFPIKRMGVAPGWSGQELLDALKAGQSKKLPYFDDFSENRGWLRSWGEMSLQDGTLQFSATPETNSSQSFLDGSYLWRDYTFKANLGWKQGAKVLLLVRFQDSNVYDNNFAACDFGDQRVRVEQRLFGNHEILAEAKSDAAWGQNYNELSARVSGKKLECLVGDHVVVSSDNLSPALGNGGGAGIGIYDVTGSFDPIIVYEVEVNDS